MWCVEGLLLQALSADSIPLIAAPARVSFALQLELGKELEERLAADRGANARTPQLLTLGLTFRGAAAGVSRSCALRKPTAQAIADDAAALVRGRGDTITLDLGRVGTWEGVSWRKLGGRVWLAASHRLLLAMRLQLLGRSLDGPLAVARVLLTQRSDQSSCVRGE